MNLIKKLFITTFFNFLFISNLFGYINISPTTFDKNIETGGYQEFTFYNDTNMPFRYKITPVAMEDGKVQDMSQWVEVYPKVVTVFPAGEKTFKVFIKADKGSPKGDYGTYLNIRQMSAPKLEGDAEENLAVGMTVMVNLNMGIYGYVGDKVPNISTDTPVVYKKDDKSFLKMKIENKTNRLVRMRIEIQGKKDHFYPVGEMRALSGQTLVLDHEIKTLGESIPKKVIITDVETKKIIREIDMI